MIIQQQVELVCCLCRDSELLTGINSSNKATSPSSYWPPHKETPLVVQTLRINLLSVKESAFSIKRICTVTSNNDKVRTVVLLQLKYGQSALPSTNLSQSSGIGLNEMPENVANFLKFIKECESLYLQEQRNLNNPIVVHCMNGVSRSAVFLAVFTVVQAIDVNCADASAQAFNIAESLIKQIKNMRQKRKYMIQTTYHLQYSYEAVLYYLKDILIKQGKLIHLFRL